jgi:hypothetical protein
MARDIEILKAGLKDAYIDYILKDVPDSGDGINYVPIKNKIEENLSRLTSNISVAIEEYIGDDDSFEFLQNMLSDATSLLSSDIMVKSIYDTDNNNRVDTAESIIINVVGTEDIPIYSCVTSDGKIGNSNNNSHSNKIIGISVEPIPIGFNGKVIVYGKLINNDWTWGTGDIFLDGTTLSQISPDVVGFSKSVGKAKSENIIIVNLEESILL